MCFRNADRAGHSYRPIEPNVKYELYGPLHETGCPLAEAGQPEGKVTNDLLLNACKPLRAASHSLYFTSVCLTLIPTWTVPQAWASCLFCFILFFLYFTWTLTHLIKKVDTDVIPCVSSRTPHWSLHLLFIVFSHFGVSPFLSGSFMNMGYIWCNPHISCLATCLVPSSWKHIRYNQKLPFGGSVILRSLITWLLWHKSLFIITTFVIDVAIMTGKPLISD